MIPHVGACQKAENRNPRRRIRGLSRAFNKNNTSDNTYSALHDGIHDEFISRENRWNLLRNSCDLDLWRQWPIQGHLSDCALHGLLQHLHYLFHTKGQWTNVNMHGWQKKLNHNHTDAVRLMKPKQHGWGISTKLSNLRNRTCKDRFFKKK